MVLVHTLDFVKIWEILTRLFDKVMCRESTFISRTVILYLDKPGEKNITILFAYDFADQIWYKWFNGFKRKKIEFLYYT